MDVYDYIDQMKEMHELLIFYVDNEENDEENFQNFIDHVTSHRIPENKGELKVLMHLIVNLSNNHHYNQFFLKKIEQILIFLQKNIKSKFTNFEIFYICKKNKRILHFLFKNQILFSDESIFKFLQQKQKYSTYLPFFYPEFKSLIEKEKLTINIDMNDFEEKRQIGENDSYLCELIRNDSIEKFVSYVNRNNIPLYSTLNQSIYETNLYLLKNNNTSLIEYATFFGSIQIFQFLRLNNIELTPSLWIYAIHGRNPEIIHILEENHVEPNDKTYVKCLEESIKCHHDDLIDYFKDNILDESIIEITFESNFWDNPVECCFHYYNMMFFPEEFDIQYLLYYACQFDYFKIVELLIKEKNCDINEEIILKLLKIEMTFFVIEIFIELIIRFFNGIVFKLND